MYKSIDLFAGIGGIRLGFDQAFGNDIKTVFISEWDKKAVETYKANFGDSVDVLGDITKVDENNKFSFNNIRLSFILDMAEIIALSLILST